MKVAMHRGMKKATLPLARRLAVIMHSIRARFTLAYTQSGKRRPKYAG
jgi:hypothetical protein